MSKPARFLSLLAVLTAGAAPLGHAYENIATVATTTTDGTPSTSEGLTYSNGVQALTGFTSASGASYAVASSAPNALIQRNGTPAQASVWYDSNGTGFAGVHQNDYGTLLKSNNFLQGSDNTFSNGTGAQNANIERLDFTWGNAFSTNLNNIAFAVFDRGVAAAHDAFTIAIVTGVSANGTPTSYGGFLRVAANWGAATNPVADRAYNLFRYANGDNLTASTAHTETGNQGVGGVVIKASEFNLPAGTSVYGYSLMAADVNPTTANDLLNVANTTVYPANTADASGGIDLAAINGLEIRLTAVPEPSACAALAVGSALVAGGWRRLRRR